MPPACARSGAREIGVTQSARTAPSQYTGLRGCRFMRKSSRCEGPSEETLEREATLQLRAARQLEDGEREYLCGVHQIINTAVFVRLMRQMEDTRSIGDT